MEYLSSLKTRFSNPPKLREGPFRREYSGASSPFLRGHDVVQAQDLGWHALENGKLITAAEQAGFDVLVTCDQNIRHQQNFAARKIALVVLSSNHWPTLRPAAGRICTKIDFAQRGQVIFVDIAALNA